MRTIPITDTLFYIQERVPNNVKNVNFVFHFLIFKIYQTISIFVSLISDFVSFVDMIHSINDLIILYLSVFLYIKLSIKFVIFSKACSYFTLFALKWHSASPIPEARILHSSSSCYSFLSLKLSYVIFLI